MHKPTYEYYSNLLTRHKLPAAVLDEDLLLANVSNIIDRAKGVKIRVASKSVRSISVLKKIISINPTAFSGIMAFTLDEAIFLADNGFDDILLGYPSMQESLIRDVAKAVKGGKRIVLMADLVEHLELINKIGKEEEVDMLVCLDADMSIKFPGVYFGVYRSSLTNKEKLDTLLSKIGGLNNINIVGLMGYEAQIAGVGDNTKGKTLINSVIRLLKKKSITKIAKRRGAFVSKLESVLNKKLDFINAGGTGSIDSSIAEKWVTEVTVGSGFYSPALFDRYKDFNYLPALFYGVELSRHPNEKIWTANGGGYTASGPLEGKLPVPYLPKGIKLIKNEAVGEVQTPFTYNGKDELIFGNPIFFRHAKAGELCERFNELIVVSNNKVIDTYKTYRGEGKCFL